MGLFTRKRWVHVISGDRKWEFVRVHPDSEAHTQPIVPWHAESGRERREQFRSREWRGAKMIWINYGWPPVVHHATFRKYFTLPNNIIGMSHCRCAVYTPGKLSSVELNHEQLLGAAGDYAEGQVAEPSPLAVLHALDTGRMSPGPQCLRLDVESRGLDKPGIIFCLSVQCECPTLLGHLREYIRSRRREDDAAKQRAKEGCWEEVRKYFLWQVVAILTAVAIGAAAKSLWPAFRAWWASR